MKHEDARVLLPEQDISIEVLIEKYAKGDERTPADVRRRVAAGLAAVEKPEARARWEKRFFDAMEAGFIPGGRINSAAGTGIAATLINCFVQPVGDNVWGYNDDGTPGIYAALQEAAETMRRGGGVGYDFSAIRPRGAMVRGTRSRASGPVSYMRVFDKSCETLESAGARRGAQMAVLRCDHPDVLEFIDAKRDGSMSNFNMSVAVTDAFMRAVQADSPFSLAHAAEPFEPAAHARDEAGRWVYRTLPARDIWDRIMASTYAHAEPGVIFIDQVNRDNNLGYCEVIEASNPCGEEFLPAYGCCCLGSINLTRFVLDPFGDRARFDFDGFSRLVPVAVRMLDNVLDATRWPLTQQDDQSKRKRRIGLGFTGLGNALAMLGLRYDSDAGRDAAAGIARAMRDAAYLASVDLARERGAFPAFDAQEYLAEPRFASRLPEPIRQAIAAHGIRNSHLLAIAPTGTISLAFAGNASGGIEPPFSWGYVRKKRMPDGTRKEYAVEDYAYRLYRHLKGVPPEVDLIPFDAARADALLPEGQAMLPAAFVTALEMSALDHVRMSAAVQPFIDSAISKTVNVAEDYPFERFKDLYLQAWESGLKGVTTYRPNSVIGSVLEVRPAGQGAAAAGSGASSASGAPATSAAMPQDLTDDPDRRLRLEAVPAPALASLRWPGRPLLPAGNMAWSFMVEPPGRPDAFAIFIGQEGDPPAPFEVWVNGGDAPRGLGAIAKSLSMDMRCQDRAWLKGKLDALAKTRDERPLQVAFPPDGALYWKPGIVAAFAEIVRWRCDQLGLFENLAAAPTPMMDAVMFRKEPKSGALGTLSWTVDVLNPATGDDFVLGVKELQLPDGTRRPYSIWLSGDYPRVLDGLCKLLSIDMRVVDASWIGLKLRKLLNFGEANGAFWAQVPGADRSQQWPSTVAYMAALILHRLRALGLVDEQGRAIAGGGILAAPASALAAGGTEPSAVRGSAHEPAAHDQAPLAGALCGDCGSYAVARVAGCQHCTACGWTGQCG